MSLTRWNPEDIFEKLPKREWWLVEHLAEAFQCTKYSIQRIAKQRGIGTLRMGTRKGRGYYTFNGHDVVALCNHVTKKGNYYGQ